LLDALALMAREIIYDDDIAVLERRSLALPDPFLEQGGFDRGSNTFGTATPPSRRSATSVTVL
jgi:hypothetical protein